MFRPLAALQQVPRGQLRLYLKYCLLYRVTVTYMEV